MQRIRHHLVFIIVIALIGGPGCSHMGSSTKGDEQATRDGAPSGGDGSGGDANRNGPSEKQGSAEVTTSTSDSTEEADGDEGKAVVFIDRGERPPSTPRADSGGGDAGLDFDDSATPGDATNRDPSPPRKKRDERKREVRATEDERADEKVTVSSDRIRVTTSKDDGDDAADESTDTASTGVRGGGLVLGHGVEVADDWSSNFETIAHEIGPVYTHPGGIPTLTVNTIGGLGSREFIRRNGIELPEGAELELPLEHTHVDVALAGPIGRVHLQQRFTNPYEEPIEAVYTFPLPENSAVDGMKMVIGERVIEGIIREKAEARAIYEQAKAQGYTAALLEQQRPNVFTQSVANIAPEVTINIETSYVQDLTYDSGKYEFVFPMVVGPRYVPAGYADGAGITPPILGRGERSGHDVSLSVRADAGVPIKDWNVPTHEAEGNLDASGRLDLRLADGDTIPNRDFVLRYAVADDEPAVSVLSEKVDGQGYFTLLVQPPDGDVDALVGTREMIFVVDVSGSMAGVPMAASKEAIELALGNLRPVDTFNIITFASGTSQLFDRARPANRQHLQLALEFVDSMEAGGGTEMLAGVSAALDAEIDAGMKRVLVFMTDGYIGNEDQVLEKIADGVEATEARKAEARIFGFGVGSSTNRYLIDGLARTGGGTAHYALTREDPAVAVDSFFNVIDHPIWTDVELDFGGLDVEADGLQPVHIPDLIASRPLLVHGRYAKGGSGTVTITARANGKTLEIPVDVKLTTSKRGGHGGVLGTLWARSAIGSLQRDMLYSNDYDALKTQITDLGLAHGIVTEFTSFVAVDESQPVEGGGDGKTIRQRVESPEGVGAE